MIEVVTWMGAAAQVYQRKHGFEVTMDGFPILRTATRPDRNRVILAMVDRI